MGNKKPSILVAEDHPATLRLLERTLVKAGYKVTTASNGREALDRFKKTFHPMVLVDWTMPEMSGLELCAALREADRQGYVYIMFLTARDGKGDVVEALESGADDYLTKPFERAELLARLKTGQRILALERSLKDANEEVRALSVTDPLTGIYNRGYLNEQLPREINRSLRYGHPLSIVLCDIDHFKAVNDTYGHQAGDKILKAFAALVRDSIRQKVDWVARYGGEEFVLVLPETDVSGGYVVAERLRKAVSQQRHRLKARSVRITVSWGVAGLPAGASRGWVTFEGVLSEADNCLLKAKQDGRNRVKACTLQPQGAMPWRKHG